MSEAYDKLAKQYEEILQGRRIGVGVGWYDLLSDYLDKLSKIDPDVKIMDIKEKFGTLRIFAMSENPDASDEVFELERIIEDRSGEICEECGDSGHSRDGGWIRTLCDECQDYYNKRKRI